MQICTKCGEAKDAVEFRQRRGKSISFCKACEREYQREHYWRNPEKARAKGKANGAKRRFNPKTRDLVLKKQREYYHRSGKYREREYLAAIKLNDPFEWRARNARSNITKEITKQFLVDLWNAQNGQCALSGRPLNIESASLDHIVPRARGGSHDLANLRWLSPEANTAKSNLLDSELFELCRDILFNNSHQIPEIIGRAILEAEGRT